VENNKIRAAVVGVCLLLGLVALGYLLGSSAIKLKEYERLAIVKGLSERESSADIVIWPIHFSLVDNDLGELYNSIDYNIQKK